MAERFKDCRVAQQVVQCSSIASTRVLQVREVMLQKQANQKSTFNLTDQMCVNIAAHLQLFVFLHCGHFI